MTTEVQVMSNLLSNDSATLVIVNFPQGGLVSLYTNGQVKNIIALSNLFGWPISNEVVANQSTFSTIYPSLLNGSVYFMTETSPSVSSTFDGLFSDELQNVADLKLRISYPLLNPLEGVLPQGYAQFPGPADLQAYMVLVNNPWYREYSSDYTMSRFVPCHGTTCLSALHYGGCYNIFSNSNTYYGVSLTQGFFDPRAYSAGDYHGIISGSSIEYVERVLSKSLNSSALMVDSEGGQSNFYSAEGIDHGNLSVPILKDDPSNVRTGASSLNINISSGGSYGGIRVDKNYQTPQNWCSFSRLGFWLFGSNTGDKTDLFNIFDGTHNGSWFIPDNFTGWKHFDIPLKNLVWCSSEECAPIDLTNVVAFYWDFHTTGDHEIDGVKLER
jgi:hypothetical protein